MSWLCFLNNKELKMNKLKIGSLIVVCALALAACGKSKPEENKAGAASPVAASAIKQEAAYKYSLTDGFDLCASKLKSKLGDAIKISDLSASYTVPDDISSVPSVHKVTKGGDLQHCDLKMQNPENAKKLVGYELNTQTDEIKGPIPVEITVRGGDAEKFNLNNSVFSIGSINFAAAQATVDGLKPKLEAKFSKYQISRVSVMQDIFSGKAEIRVAIDGILKANDVKKNIWMTIAADGKKITAGEFK